MSDLDKFRNNGDAKYNSHLDTLQRINWIIWSANMAGLRTDLQGMHDVQGHLLNLHKELLEYCNEKEQAELNKLMVFTLPNVQTAQKFRTNIDIPGIRKDLFAWEMELRRIVAKKGLGLKSGADARLAL